MTDTPEKQNKAPTEAQLAALVAKENKKANCALWQELRQKGVRGFFKNRSFMWWFKTMFWTGVAGGIAGVLLVAGVIFYFAQQVPDFRTLADYRPALVTKVYAHDGHILAEYASERRIYMPIERIPQQLKNAYLAAEDTGFYQHKGFDLKGIIRAALVNIFTSRKQGASTITQQLVKTSLLSSERTYTRKIKEVILAWRIENFLSKDEILELYLNQIYLGNGAYGVGAAAVAYFDKALDELSISQFAMLAGLPKAPSAYNPMRHPREARMRRDVVIKRMEAEQFITPQEAQEAIDSDLGLNPKSLTSGEEAPHFSEHIRRSLEEKYGSDGLYKGGYAVHTTLDARLQKFADESVYSGLRRYDRRHGFRGAIGRMNILLGWQKRLKTESEKWQHMKKVGEPAVVLETKTAEDYVVVGLTDDTTGTIPLKAMEWARRYKGVNALGPKIKKVNDVLEVGDIVFVKPWNAVPEGKRDAASDVYSLEQVPKVQGALVALDAKSGAVRAMVGGLGQGTGFNRAVQAMRQTGSAFKPFVYAYALTRGFTPASIILDAPVVLRNEEMDDAWKPQNYSEKVYGPSTLRLGLEKSRNLMTIRLARKLGMGNILDFARSIGLEGKMERNLSTALGSSVMSLLDLTAAYGIFPSGGMKVDPYFIERIQDVVGNTVYTPKPDCVMCAGSWTPFYEAPPSVEHQQEQVLDPKVAYMITSMLQGVVQRGTGWRAKKVGHPVGAKTGTTNDYIDAWFMGFSSDLVVGVWVGFDNPQTMGNHETGSGAAGPIWSDFMEEALRGQPQHSFAVPEGVSFVRIDKKTGLLPSQQTKETLVEAFAEGTEPTEKSQELSVPDVSEDQSTGSSGPVIFQGIY